MLAQQLLVGRLRRSLVTNRKYCTVKENPIVITVAITGDVHNKIRNIAVPISQAEQVESTCEAFSSGARLVHIHVRDDNGKCTWKPEYYQKVIEGIRKHCPEMIVEFSLGNYAPSVVERVACLDLNPDLASLCPGSVNFKASRPGEGIARDFINSHADIDYICNAMLQKNVKPDVAIFDVSMIYNTADLIKRGLIKTPVRLMYVMGGHMAMESRRPLLEFLVRESTDVLGEDNFNWACVGVGWNHTLTQKWTIDMGGHSRTGFEDSLMIKRGKFAQSNRELVENVVNMAKEAGRRVATPSESRKILGLE